MEVKKTKSGIILPKCELTQASKWPQSVHVVCDEGYEASVESLIRETCDKISSVSSVNVDVVNPGSCDGDQAIGEDTYREVFFDIQPK